MSSAPDADLLVLGASFAGLGVVRRLLRRRPRFPGSIAVVDRFPRQVYLPLVHEWLVGRIAEPACRVEAAGYLTRHAGVRFVRGEVTGFDPARGEVRLEDGRRLRAPIVVVALGSVLAPPPGLPGRALVHRYKAWDEAHASRTVLGRLLARPRARIVVAGGGLSGVELAAELAHAARRAGRAGHEVWLVTRSQAILPSFAPPVAARCRHVLERIGVRVEVDTAVAGVSEGAVSLDGPGGRRAPACDAVFWAGGVRPSPVLQRLGLATDDDGAILCDAGLQARTAAGEAGALVFACGDGVSVLDPAGARLPTTRRAIECLWQARVVADNVAASIEAGEAVTPARHRARGPFPYGISLGPRSLVVWREAFLDVPAVGIGLRRLLMRLYHRRFAPGT